MTKYQATAERGRKYWLVRVDGVGTTQARRLVEVDEMATDLVAVMTGAAPESFTVEVDVQVPDVVRNHLARAAALRDESRRTNAEAAAEVRAAAQELSSSGMPLRDIGRVLGVSYQRAHQLVRS